MTHPMRPRSGAALIVALLVMLVLDCIVLGTMHLAMLERRLATNAVDVLRLRLAAEGTVRESLGHWSAAVDTLSPDDAPIRFFTTVTRDGLPVNVDAFGTAADAWLLRAESRLLRPYGNGDYASAGRAAAALLVRPPALAPALKPATAAITAAGPLRVRSGAAVTALGGPCDAGPTHALRVASASSVELDAGAVIEGSVTSLSPDTDVPGHRDRLFARADSVYDTDLRLDRDFAGALLVQGTLSIAADVSVTGFVVVGGDLIVEAGASITGAVHVAGSTILEGAVVHDSCTADAAIDNAHLRTPRAFTERAWLPAF